MAPSHGSIRFHLLRVVFNRLEAVLFVGNDVRVGRYREARSSVIVDLGDGLCPSTVLSQGDSMAEELDWVHCCVPIDVGCEVTDMLWVEGGTVI